MFAYFRPPPSNSLKLDFSWQLIIAWLVYKARIKLMAAVIAVEFSTSH